MGQTGSNPGQTPRSGSSSGGTNNLPPLLFHQVHGDNIRVSRDGAVARRAESFCKGVAFTSRPVKPSEKVCVKFLEVSNNWSGVIRFGFTSSNPSTLRGSLPKYACPDLTNKPGYWAKALAERFCERDTVLFYYVTLAGDVHFGINGEEKGVFFSGVDTRGELWAMIDVYGNSTVIELLDYRQQLNNTRRHNGGGDSSPDSVVEAVDRLIMPNMAALSIHNPPSPPPMREEDPTPPPPRFQQPSARYTPLPFHRLHGCNVRLSPDRCIASRIGTEFCQGYVFTARPIQLGERIVIQVLATELLYLGGLALGLTSCDPASLAPGDLPEDADLLLDRPEYWVVSKDVAGQPQRGDELAFSISGHGELIMSKNGGAPSTLLHVDQSLQLWAFFDIYGSTQSVRVLGSPQSQQSCSPPRSLRVSLPEAVVSNVTVPRCCPGTVLVVNLPPAPAPPPPLPIATTTASSGTLLSTCSHTYIEPVSGSYSTLDSSPRYREWAETSLTAPQSSECSICYERSIDSVLYMCGHMCMCYECAVQQWKGKGGGHCPLCRALIRDVIRTYKS